jgi:hypothetical protein
MICATTWTLRRVRWARAQGCYYKAPLRRYSPTVSSPSSPFRNGRAWSHIVGLFQLTRRICVVGATKAFRSRIPRTRA